MFFRYIGLFGGCIGLFCGCSTEPWVFIFFENLLWTHSERWAGTNRPLLRIYGAVLRIYMALLRIYRALLRIRKRAVYSSYRFFGDFGRTLKDKKVPIGLFCGYIGLFDRYTGL